MSLAERLAVADLLMRYATALDAGDVATVVDCFTEDAVLEVSPDKRVVWRYDVPFPYLATRLPNGNTLISSGNGYGSPTGFYVIEVSAKGETVWNYGGADAPPDQNLNWPSGFLRLKNGNTLISIARAARSIGNFAMRMFLPWASVSLNPMRPNCGSMKTV